MHRATPINSSFRAFVAGGARATIPEVDDSKWMQETKFNASYNESNQTGKNVEAPQNFGFTSVVMDAVKDATGKIQSCAETFVQYIGGNRSFPVMQNMDDRRHRLTDMLKGDSGMFSTVGRMLQSHLNQDGMFHTGPRDKTVRMQLVDKDSQDDNQIQQGQVRTMLRRAGVSQQEIDRVMPLDTSGGGGGGSSGGGDQEMGQKSLYKDGQQSFRFVDVTKDKTRMGGTQCHMMLDDNKTYVHAHSDKNVYVGAEAGKATFDFLVTLSGPCVNSKGKIGG
jgi:hypothetical protein